MTPFEILGVSEDADDARIKQAYLQKVREYPPERAPRQFQRAREAYERIQSGQKRLEYRLFHTHEPSVAEILEHLLQQRGAPQRPSAQALRQALATSLQTGNK
jgi:curved DNA-binding protein CbpA